MLIRSVVARLHFEQDATSSDTQTTPSRHVRAKLHFSQLIDTSMLHDEKRKAEFRKRLGKHKRSPHASLEKQVYDLQHAFRYSAIHAFGRPRKGPTAPWIPKRTWDFVQL